MTRDVYASVTAHAADPVQRQQESDSSDSLGWGLVVVVILLVGVVLIKMKNWFGKGASGSAGSTKLPYSPDDRKALELAVKLAEVIKRTS